MTSQKVFGQKGRFWPKTQKTGHVTYAQTLIKKLTKNYKQKQKNKKKVSYQKSFRAEKGPSQISYRPGCELDILSYRLYWGSIHIFYEELTVDENNIFTANIAEENEIEEVRFQQSKEYAVAGLSINQDIVSRLVAVTDTNRQEAISNSIQKLVTEKKRSRSWP